MNKKVLIGGIAGIAVLGFLGYGLLAPQPSDEVLIQQALDDALQASKEGRPGSVLDFLAEEFNVNGEQFAKAQISDRIRKLKPHIEFATRTPSITGDTAELTSPVKLSVSLPPLSVDISEVNVKFERQDGKRMLFFPAKQWKMTDVTVPQDVMDQVASSFGGG